MTLLANDGSSDDRSSSPGLSLPFSGSLSTPTAKAISLYRSMGFEAVGRRKGYYPAAEGREDAIIMSRTLPLP